MASLAPLSPARPVDRTVGHEPPSRLDPGRPPRRLAGVTTSAAPRQSADFDRLVAGALAGDRASWEALVEALQRVAWKAIGGFDLSPEDRKDAFAATFYRLYERLDSVREPAKLPGWIATTARNEVHTLLRSRRRLVLDDSVERRSPVVSNDLGAGLMDDELRVALRAAFTRLSPACQELLHLLTVDPPLSYAEIGDLLGMPHGSIGPTRNRCLQRLRETPELRPFLDEESS